VNDWLPQASTNAPGTDSLFRFALALCVGFLALITVLMVVFVLRYRRERHPRAAQIEGNTLLEIVWTVVPLALFLVIFHQGWLRYDQLRRPPRDALAVAVTARQWKYGFRYPNGRQTSRLYAPLGRPVKLELRSADVIHGFFVPAFRLKLDVVPGRTGVTWFQATRTGAYDLLCTVVCGVDHSRMLSQVVVVPEAEFRAWYFGPEDAPEPGAPALPPAPPAPDQPEGLRLLRSKGCLDCHSLDGSPLVGPSLKGVFGRREEVSAGGRTRSLTVDEARLRRAITRPGEELVQGYPPSMPETPLEPGELDAMVAYLRSLR